MAFTRSSLARIGTANSDAGAVWIYKSADAIGTVRAANYFSTADATGGELNGTTALGMMNEGDVILICDANSTHKTLSATVVKSVSATAIDCGDGSDLSTADSD